MQPRQCAGAGLVPAAEEQDPTLRAEREHLQLPRGVQEARGAGLQLVPDGLAVREPGHDGGADQYLCPRRGRKEQGLHRAYHWCHRSWRR